MAQTRGEKAYEMRLGGMQWAQIGRALGCRPRTAGREAEAYARAIGVAILVPKPAPIEKPEKIEAMPEKAKKWHRMHCGRAMVAEKIAAFEKIHVEVVRKTLRKYRERKWGCKLK